MVFNWTEEALSNVKLLKAQGLSAEKSNTALIRLSKSPPLRRFRGGA